MNVRQIRFGLHWLLGALACASTFRGDRVGPAQLPEPAARSSTTARVAASVTGSAASDTPTTPTTTAPAADQSHEAEPAAFPARGRRDPALAVLDYPVGTADEASLVRDLPPLVDRWTTDFPEEAAEWTEALPEGLARDLSAVTVARRRARTNPLLAGIWLKSFPGIEDLLGDPPDGPARTVP